jgi:membrane associated rhomboid family serine protease
MKLTLALTAIIIAVFLYVTFFVPDPDAFFSYYGFSGANMLARPYVLLTSIFLHSGIEHLLSNVLVLLFFGFAVEKEMGPLRTLGVFLLGAAAGDLLSLAIYPFDAVSVGASAGIFALIGIGMLVRPLDLSFYPLVVPIPLLFLGIGYIAYNFYGFFFLPNSDISYMGHFGGLFVGLLAGIAKTGMKKGIGLLAAGTAVLAAVLAVIWYFFLR